MVVVVGLVLVFPALAVEVSRLPLLCRLAVRVEAVLEVVAEQAQPVEVGEGPALMSIARQPIDRQRPASETGPSADCSGRRRSTSDSPESPGKPAAAVLAEPPVEPPLLMAPAVVVWERVLVQREAVEWPALAMAEDRIDEISSRGRSAQFDRV